MTALAKPSFTLGIAHYCFDWNGTGVKIEVSHVADEGVGEIAVYGGDNASSLLHLSRINLLSTRSCKETANRLSEEQAFDWEHALLYVAALTMQHVRRGEPVEELGKRPEALKREYQLLPIIPLNQPTTIYAPGGSVKSLLAIYIACLVQYHMASPLGWVAQQGNVLYLDWEDTRETHERRMWAIKAGLEIPEDVTIAYRRCAQPFTQIADDVARIVSDRAISLVIIDSAMAAMTSHAYSSDPSDPVSQFYNALRSLNCTTLTLDHVAKHRDDQDELSGPYGSVVKRNRARNQFEIQKSQEKGSNVVWLNMIHTKANEGMLLKDRGIEVTFDNDSEGDAQIVKFEPVAAADVPAFAHKMSLKDQATNVLLRGPRCATDLASEMGLTKQKYHSLYAMLNDWKGKPGGFVKLENEQWGLLVSPNLGGS